MSDETLHVVVLFIGVFVGAGIFLAGLVMGLRIGAPR